MGGPECLHRSRLEAESFVPPATGLLDEGREEVRVLRVRQVLEPAGGVNNVAAGQGRSGSLFRLVRMPRREPRSWRAGRREMNSMRSGTFGAQPRDTFTISGNLIVSDGGDSQAAAKLTQRVRCFEVVERPVGTAVEAPVHRDLEKAR